MEHNKPNWDKLQAISVLTSDSPKLGPALKKNPYIYISSSCQLNNKLPVLLMNRKQLVQLQTLILLTESCQHSYVRLGTNAVNY